MDNSKQKWLRFGLGASPTLFFTLNILVASSQNSRESAGVTAFFGSIVYLVIGLIIYGGMFPANPEKKALAKAFLAGIVAGSFTTFVLSVFSCF